MNITFFIGNGFDINLGLKTRYSDFYPYFIEKATTDNMIRTWLKEDDLLWADLEEELGKKLKDVKIDELEKFYEDKAELDRLLLEYLGTEQEKISIQEKKEKVSEEFARSLISFDNDLHVVGRNSISSTCNVYKNHVFYYCFICFNYTNVLDQIVEVTKRLKSPITTHPDATGVKKNSLLGSLLHIHGTLDEEMILGVNDVNQVNNEFLQDDMEFLDTFIKNRMNNSIGQRKTERAKRIIEDSHIICIFGMSIGNTDKMWWEEIVKWLNESENNKLIIYYKDHNNELERKLPVNIIRLNNRIKREILEKGGANIKNLDIDQVKERIFIAYNSQIFRFKEIVFGS